MNKPTHIVTHHAASASPDHTVKDVDDWHRARWPDFRSSLGYWVGYHYVIERDGTVTKTRQEYEEGAHCIGMNLSSIGVCFMGHFDHELPTEAQKQAWMTLYSAILTRHAIPPSRIVPHRHYANKSCHGSLLSDTYFAELVGTVQRKRLLDLRAALLRVRSLLSHKRFSRRER